jgi:ferritin-like metal-binding protein YciE
MTDHDLMKKKTPGTVPPYPTQWASDKLTSFLTEHLNRIYCANAHLAERLLEISGTSSFKDLNSPIKETIDETEKHIAIMDGIYVLLQKRYSFDNCSSLIALLEDEFTAIHQQGDDELLRDMCVLSYLQNIENVEKNSIQLLQLTAIEKSSEPITLFLDKYLNHSEVKRTLYNFIIDKYNNDQKTAINL